MNNWLYVLRPELNTTHDGPSTTAHYRQLAATGPFSCYWDLGRPLKAFGAGDRIWIYFATPENQVAAMADVTSDWYLAPTGARKPYRFDGDLHAAATRTLTLNPVPLTAMTNHFPQGCIGVTDADVRLFERHAGL